VNGPLEGTRVIELGVWVAGPAAGGLLADWGADVVKIEPPDGDPARRFAQMLGGDIDLNPPFELDNRGKRSIVVDVTSDRGREVAHQLVEGADVFVTNVRPQALARLDLDYGRLSSLNPGLVYGIITGYGTEGPEADRASYDIGAYWARAGIVSLLTPPGADPIYQRGGMGDHTVAMTLAGAVCAALVARQATGHGQLVHTSLLRQGAYTVGFDLSVALRFGVPVATPTRQTMTNPLVSPFKAADGKWLWLIGLEPDRHWPDLASAVGHPEWVNDPRFATRRARARHSAALTALLDEAFVTRTREQWAEVLDESGMWWAPVQSTDEVLDDPQLAAAGGFVEVPDGPATSTLLASPVDFRGTPAAVRSMPPRLGEHTDDVLSELGRSHGEIAELRESGAVG
jgi:crotonobetainyl-CoA:carnitine CoA-transferase CaiB-like acyl-CoA transferase